MKRHRLLSACLRAGFCLVLLLSAQTTFGQTVKTITLNYEEDDFEYHYDSMGRLRISSSRFSSVFSSDTSSYSLPLISVLLLINDDEDYAGMNYNVEGKSILENVEVAKRPCPIQTSRPQCSTEFSGKIKICNNNVEYIRTRQYGNYKLLNFYVSPYSYDAKSKSLQFFRKIIMNVNLCNSKPAQTRKVIPQKDLMKDIVRSMIINPEDIDKQEKSSYALAKQSMNSRDDVCDYVIITNNALSNSFQQLANWKNQKGVRTEIVTTEYIYENYSASSNQLKIKLFLKDCHDNRGLQYALLGGDDTVVPVQMCKSYVFPLLLLSNYIPADLYYATFKRQFDWNGNGNNDFGEYADSISYDPDIFVSRLPVRTSTEVLSFISRLLEYEKNPPVNDWKNSMLMCCTKLSSMNYEYPDSICDTYYQGRLFYDNYIAPYWNGNSTFIYESSGSNLNADTLQMELTKGYPFVNVLSHGMPDYWKMPNNMNYNCGHAAALSNSNPTIITTSACFTNAFDENLWFLSSDPCLSESFFRNPNSGILAFFGCSREGISTIDVEELGASDECNADFYRILFSGVLSENNYARVAAAAKMNMPEEHSFLFDYNENTHWLQLGVNPTGDPEMPIFTEKPKTFCNVKLLWYANGLAVKPGVSGTRVCLMSLPDNGTSFYDVNYPTDTASFYNIPDSFSVCITKQGFVPYIVNMSRNSMTRYIQNETLVHDQSYSGISIEIGSDVTDEKPHGPVIINRGNISVDGTQEVTIKNDFEVEQGATLIINEY